MNILQQWVDRISGIVWGPGTVAVMLLIGAYFTVRSGFLVFRPRLWLTETLRRLTVREKPGSRLTRRQALATALAGTMGTGNIAGVATAIALGGPGAVFWMWVSGCAGMMIKYAETALAVKFRHRTKGGRWQGGVPEVLTYGLGMKRMAAVFAVCCVLASFGMGNMAQGNTIAQSLRHAFRVPPTWTAAGCAMAAGLVICGGLGRIGRVAERVIPLLSILYGAGGLIVIGCHASQVGPALWSIVTGAFSGQAAVGGVAGATVAAAMRYGFSAGIFSNEAGLGSSGMIYAAADDADPTEQGLWSMFEVFVDTMVVCSITALAILTSGVCGQGLSGADLTIAAFETVFGPWGSGMVAVSVALFAWASMLGWACYGEQSWRTLTRSGGGVYRFLFIGAAALGCLLRLELVWGMSEIFNGLMAVPNLIALVLLAGEVTYAPHSNRR